jgi:hypothetical protein
LVREIVDVLIFDVRFLSPEAEEAEMCRSLEKKTEWRRRLGNQFEEVASMSDILGLRFEDGVSVVVEPV